MSRTKLPMAVTTHGGVPRLGRRLSARHVLAFLLRAASAALDRLAERVATPAARHEPLPVAELEFYAQAGAPEGALYVDGQFVGWIQGVQRL
jgi:hypothetical protein